MAGASRRQFLRVGAAGVGAAALPAGAAALTDARGAFADDLAAAPDDPLDRSAYSLDPRVVYFNHASIGTIPRSVQKIRTRYLEICESNPWLYMWGGAWEQPREETRRRVAELLGASPDEIALNHNTTEGFNVLADGLPLGPGDEVLFSSLNHAGASVCWHHRAARRGFTVKSFAFPMDRVAALTADEIVALYAEQVTDKTRVLVFPHVDNTVGVRHPLRALCAMARERGVEFVAADGAQSIGTLDVDLGASGVDFYCGSPHKWLQAPKGVGVFYAAKRALDQVSPSWVTWGQTRWAGTARVLEDYGTRNLAEVLTLGDAVQFWQRIPMTKRRERLAELRAHALEIVEASAGKLRWQSPRDANIAGCLWSIGLDGDWSPADVAKRLFEDEGFVVRPFGGGGAFRGLRVSPNTFDAERDVERFLGLLG